MKNLKKLLMACVMLFSIIFIVSCSSNEPKTKTFVKEDTGIKMELTYTYVGDKVTKQTANNVINYSALGFDNVEDTKTALEPVLNQYNDIKGLKHFMDYKENEAREYLEVDYENIDYEKAKSVPGIMITGDPKSGVSMKASEKLITEQGFVEKK